MGCIKSGGREVVGSRGRSGPSGRCSIGAGAPMGLKKITDKQRERADVGDKGERKRCSECAGFCMRGRAS